MLPQDMPTSILTVRGHLIPSIAGASTSMHSFSKPWSEMSVSVVSHEGCRLSAFHL